MEVLKKIYSALNPAAKEDDYLDDYEKLSETRHAPSGDRREVSIRTTANLHVALVQPKTMQELPEIMDEMRQGMTLVLNIEQTDRETSRRVLDMLAGVAYALDANISRIATNTYMILPFNVELEDSFLHQLHSSGFSFGADLAEGL